MLPSDQEQDAIYIEWKSRRFSLAPERVIDAAQRVEVLRRLIINSARGLLGANDVVLPEAIRTELEQLLKGEESARRDAA